ncbi:hypothetical protein SS50377_27320 [Spironucleus salmonicida]|uniref:Uncharacterized protein n=1 Tax=Spironucleus salmonicida TaxID=348837 RepID=V6LRG5_9EUKA|nr:hypothetical protein SS50377_27320 [Spironucleus salmonicida]|eukprot:EST43379.1 Hypothetical protein SS50377_17059 [Spironucleus salmonicida]
MSRSIFLAAKKPLDTDFQQLLQCYLQNPHIDTYLDVLLEYDLASETTQFMLPKHQVPPAIQATLHERNFDEKASLFAYNVALCLQSQQISEFYVSNAPLSPFSFLFWTINPSCDPNFLAKNYLPDAAFFIALQHAAIAEFPFSMRFMKGLNLASLPEDALGELLRALQIIRFPDALAVALKVLRVSTSNQVVREALRLTENSEIEVLEFEENCFILTQNLTSVNANVVLAQLKLLVERFAEFRQEDVNRISQRIDLGPKIVKLVQNRTILKAREIGDLVCDLLFIIRENDDFLNFRDEVIDELKMRFKGRESMTLQQTVMTFEYEI